MSQTDVVELKRTVQVLKDQIKRNRSVTNDTTLQQAASQRASIVPQHIQCRRTLQGHLGKIYALDWADDSKRIVSAAQDGKLIVWDAYTTYKLHAISLRSEWVLACGFSPGSGRLVSCGGLEDDCLVYNIESEDAPNRIARKLSAHSGYISSCKFLSEHEILTSSGDSTCIQWNVETGQLIRKFCEHSGDVMSVSVDPRQSDIFASGSIDCSVKIWDMRTGRSMQSFVGHGSDVNAVQFFPSGQAIASGSDDATCRLFDLRADRELAQYLHPSITSGVTSLSFSKCGGLLFGGYENHNCYVWDTLKCQLVHTIQGHEERVTCVQVSPDGNCLATGSWDHTLKVWA